MVNNLQQQTITIMYKSSAAKVGIGQRTIIYNNNNQNDHLDLLDVEKFLLLCITQSESSIINMHKNKVFLYF